MNIEEQLIANGYKKHEVDRRFNEFAKCMYQKKIKNDNNDTRYFIDFYIYESAYEVALQFEARDGNYTINITLFAFDRDMTVQEVEEEVYKIWFNLDCKYYEKGE